MAQDQNAFLTIDIRDIMAMLESMTGEAMDRAVAKGLAQTADQSRTAAVSAISKQMGTNKLGREYIKRRITWPYIPIGSRRVRVSASRKGIPLISFSPSQTGEGVRIRAWGKSQTLQHAFITNMHGSGGGAHGGVYRRAIGAGRLPVKELWGPTVAGTYTTPVVAARILQRLQTALPKNLARQIRNEQRRAARQKR